MMKPNGEIQIICSRLTPRIQCIAGYLTSATGTPFTVASSFDYADITGMTNSPVIHYDDSPVNGAFNIFASGFLAETGIREFEPAVLKKGEQILLFPAPAGFDLPFDLFSAVFYLISRYEEYLPFQPDEHGRFEAGQSLAFRCGFIEEPVVDQWIEWLKTSLTEKYPQLSWPRQEFTFKSTFDVDNPWAYLHKGFFRTAGALCKQVFLMNFSEFRIRLEALRGKTPDPFDTYDYILNIEKQFGIQSCFFFLTGGYGEYDTNYALSSMAFKKLLKRLNSGRMIGIHPSFRSSRSLPLLRFEVERFTRFLGRQPEASRMHFLMLKFPETYRRLINLHLKEDYSLGYASCIGFRAGTSRPFRFYDLLEECETGFLIHPFLIMDVTLRQYLGLAPDEALNRIKSIVEKVKAVNGIFTSLWHNESLSDVGEWKGWRRVFEEMVKMAN